MCIGVVIYILEKNVSARKPGPRLDAVCQTIIDLLACVEVVPVLATHFVQSIGSGFLDFEDGAQYFAATAMGRIDAVVSRDTDYMGKIAGELLTAAEALRYVRKHSA